MASTEAISTATEKQSIPYARLAKYGVISLIAVIAVNIAILYIGLATVEFPSEFVGGPFGPLAIGPVVINSAVAAIGATVVYGIITRYASRPDRTFTIVAGIALILSFGMFFAPDIAGATPALFATLGLMHIASAVVIVGLFTRTANRDGGA